MRGDTRPSEGPREQGGDEGGLQGIGATQDTACRCYLRGPDGVSGLAPPGNPWNILKYNRRNRSQVAGCHRPARRAGVCSKGLSGLLDLDRGNLDRGGILLHLDLRNRDLGAVDASFNYRRVHRIGDSANDRLLHLVLPFSGLLAPSCSESNYSGGKNHLSHPSLRYVCVVFDSPNGKNGAVPTPEQLPAQFARSLRGLCEASVGFAPEPVGRMWPPRFAAIF